MTRRNSNRNGQVFKLKEKIRNFRDLSSYYIKKVRNVVIKEAIVGKVYARILKTKPIRKDNKGNKERVTHV